MHIETTYKPVRFFLITFLFTWIPWFISAYFSYQSGMAEYQLLFMIPGLFAPSIAALMMLSGPHNKQLRTDFWDRLRFNRIKPSFLPALFLLVPFIVLAATAISLLFGLSADQFTLSSEVAVLKGHGLISLLILFLAPTFEELGWRGYGVDSLASKRTVFQTSLLFGVLWGLWHAPLFFINGYYHHWLWNTNIAYVINFFLSVIAASFLMNWIYFKNGRSITAAIIFHFMLDIFYVLFRTEPCTKCIATFLMLIIAAILVVADKTFFFGHVKR
jgi:uncharacterized protein